MALFISLEGGEGSGKTAVTSTLAARLQRAGADVVHTFEPGGTEFGAAVRQWLFQTDQPLSAWSETFLFLADRTQHVAEVIRPALARGAVVLCDRYADSTLAYQGYGRGLDLRLLRDLNQHATGGLMPNLTLFLDVPVQEGLRRARSEGPDRIGGEVLAFHMRVSEGYKRLTLAEPDRIRTLDAAVSLSEVIAAAWAAIAPRLQRAGFALTSD